MKTIEKVIKRAGYAHDKQYKRILRAREFVDTDKKQELYDEVLKTWQDSGRMIIELEEYANILKYKLNVSEVALKKFLKEI